MDSEEVLFKRLSRKPYEACNPLVHTLWTNYSKADRIKNYRDEKFMDELLIPVGWTAKEYWAESNRLSQIK